MKKIREELGTTFVFSTHDSRIIGEAESIYRIEDGMLKTNGNGGGRTMANLIKIAARNLFRYKRRTLLTLSLIVIGVLFVTGFMAVTGSFKTLMIGQITDSFVGHMQIHRKGYLAAIDNLPLTMNMKPQAVKKVEAFLKETPEIEAYSMRIKFGGMFSNFTETTNIRLNGVDPEKEAKPSPASAKDHGRGERLKKGEILVPELLARGMKVKVGDMVVVIATNRDGSVNGKQLKVGGILESATGPGGRDGYVHMEDAVEILRMEEMEISEIAVRLKDFDRLHEVFGNLEGGFPANEQTRGNPSSRCTPGKTLPLLQYRPHDRHDDLLYQDHACRHCAHQHHERDDHGGLRAGERDRDHRSHRDPAPENPFHVPDRRVPPRRHRCSHREFAEHRHDLCRQPGRIHL
jgi:bifunctional DNA-binding transcriptional regulator/antitoxin component of YhaV-PrlF toxin-antitoxin module